MPIRSAVRRLDARPRSGCRSLGDGGTHDASLPQPGAGGSPARRTAPPGGAPSPGQRGARRSARLAPSATADSVGARVPPTGCRRPANLRAQSEDRQAVTAVLTETIPEKSGRGSRELCTQGLGVVTLRLILTSMSATGEWSRWFRDERSWRAAVR